MTYLDPSGSTGDSTDGADHRRHRARHGGAAPEPYNPSSGDETLVFDQPLRTTGPRRSRADTQRSRAERRRAEEAGRASDAGQGPVGYAAPGPDSGRGGEAEPASAPGDERPPSRAGRNLPAAIGVGVSLGIVVLGSLLFWRPAFLAVVLLAVGGAIWEMTRAVRPSGAHPPLAPLLAGGATMVGLAWFGGPEALALGLLLTVLAVIVWRLSDGPAAFQRDITVATLITMYVPFLGGFAALLAVPERDGHLRILVTLAAVVLSDTGGYVCGVFLGRHPMAPTVSPKKSWEGLAGSLLASAVGSGLLLFLLMDIAPWWGAVFGLVLSGAAVLGDLTESMIKRDLGVKDMSTLLPGHGGLMDRLDSILFALPASYLMLTLLAPPPG